MTGAVERADRPEDAVDVASLQSLQGVWMKLAGAL